MTADLLPQLREWIGRESGPVTAPGPVEWSDVRRFLNATGDANPRWIGRGGAAPPVGTPVPPAMILDVLRPPPGADVPGEDGERGFPSLGGLAATIPVPGERMRLNAATDIEWFRPLRIGEVVSVLFTILDVAAGETQQGPAVFITEERRYSNQDGERIATVRQTTVRIRGTQ